MDFTLGFLIYLFSVLRIGGAHPLSEENIISKVTNDVFLLQHRLSNFTAVDILLPEKLSDRIGGISSVVVVLEGCNRLIPDNFNNLSQIKKDISSLSLYLIKRKERKCKLMQQMSEVPGWLQRLQTITTYTETRTIVTLMRLKEFLNLLLQDLSVLKTC